MHETVFFALIAASCWAEDQEVFEFLSLKMLYFPVVMKNSPDNESISATRRCKGGVKNGENKGALGR